jgi:hypothetical protein
MKKLKSHLRKELLRLEVSKIDYFLDSIHRANGTTPTDDPLPFEDSLSSLWNTHFNSYFNDNLEELEKTGMLTIAFSLAYEALRSYNLNEIEPKALTEAIQQTLGETVALLDRPFDIRWALQEENEINAIVETMYENGRKAAIEDLGSEDTVENDERDNNAIAQIATIGVIYSSISTESQIIMPIATRLVREGLIGDVETTAMTNTFAQGLRELIPLKSDIYYQQLSSVIIGRARNYGKILAYDNLGVLYLEVQSAGDDRVCGRCMLFDSMVFRTSDLTNVIENAISASTLEEYIDANPFVNGLDAETNEFILGNQSRIPVNAGSEALASAGLLPSYHPGCRCTVVEWRG